MLPSVIRGLRSLRIVTVIFALAAMLCVTAASVSPAHTHLKDPAGRCDICVTAHLASRQVAVVQVVHALALQSLLVAPVAIQRVESRVVLSTLTRGPPSSL